ncbi:putative cell wall binding repeat protein [Clostridium saccharobutylicum]|uniref:Putative cell wall binding repeat protein n=1 Tax=Clostridium saccharobutylicum DSM 13864 TaxID=1345695 RepID=U5MV02_CLOSA|nr:putative cell wall binding repeat protein [Clostridium saccharobutylicum]AGX43461.1 putative cell wall binding repeat protein [Clostridium saccharobutylicum DSM 13864]AQR90760.1 hypothetical protein CLOSC_24810 [Clostridium saccharobutylicum]AQS00664.1 hypothetical protein CSACC_24880 [Clostridium saccharobutylicum]AQS14647.1 hypothetical protein CLOSACC_24880 [Clostridium saccharobutylicum]MBA2906437.1 glucan-binding YG repeat protein [Clostridium saccharobutylicum]
MITKHLNKIITLWIMAVLLLAFNPMGASARVSENEAKDLILRYGNDDIFSYDYNYLKTNLVFSEEVSKDKLDDGLLGKGLYKITKSNENLYYFQLETDHYYVGVDSGQIYLYDGGSGCGTFHWIENNKVVKVWYWGRKEIDKDGQFGGWEYSDWQQNNGWVLLSDNTWSYYVDGLQKTGWIYDNGNWYYCYSNGQMAHDTTIAGYYLGSNGAWTNN